MTKSGRDAYLNPKIRAGLDDLKLHLTLDQINQGEKLSQQWLANYWKTQQ
jgi:hypothetical protein